MKHRSVYRTELSPVSFLERSAAVFPDKTAVVHGARRYSYRGVRGAGQPAGLRAARGRPAEARPRRVPLPEHPGDAGGALRRARRRRHPGRDQHAAQRRRDRLHPRATPARASCSSTPSWSRWSRRSTCRHHASCASTTPGSPATPTRSSWPTGSPEPVGELARGRGGDDRDQLHLRHDRPAQGRDVHLPRRLPQRARQGDRDRAERRERSTSGRCRCSTATAGASPGRSPRWRGTHVCLRRVDPAGSGSCSTPRA